MLNRNKILLMGIVEKKDIRFFINDFPRVDLKRFQITPQFSPIRWKNNQGKSEHKMRA